MGLVDEVKWVLSADEIRALCKIAWYISDRVPKDIKFHRISIKLNSDGQYIEDYTQVIVPNELIDSLQPRSRVFQIELDGSIVLVNIGVTSNSEYFGEWAPNRGNTYTCLFKDDVKTDDTIKYGIKSTLSDAILDGDINNCIEYSLPNKLHLGKVSKGSVSEIVPADDDTAIFVSTKGIVLSDESVAFINYLLSSVCPSVVEEIYFLCPLKEVKKSITAQDGRIVIFA